MTPPIAGARTALPAAIARHLADCGHRIILTGASGWLGLATLELLAQALGPDWQQRICCFGSSARTLDLGGGLTAVQRPLAELAHLPPASSLLLHLAFLTKDKVAGMSEADYVAANAAIARTVEDALLPIDVRAIWVASSGAAYRADDAGAAPAMQLYGRLKRDDETRFADWAARTGRRAVITRVFNVSGRHINKPEHYALASFILAALAGQTVTVKAPHRVERGMIAIAELMAVVFAELLAAPAGVSRFDSGGLGLELGDIAAEVAGELGAPGHARAALTSERVDRYLGDEAAWDALCRRHGVPRVPLAQQIRETAAFLAEAGLAP
jgi:nucleoside-diphosphate-sugar epimerase